ncbi:MAG: hypothetical protein PHU23_02710 [Dehalococcoidales bacterium]|nr:hypothetical protein [Dehalococcoidales bacterium]
MLAGAAVEAWVWVGTPVLAATGLVAGAEVVEEGAGLDEQAAARDNEISTKARLIAIMSDVNRALDMFYSFITFFTII